MTAEIPFVFIVTTGSVVTIAYCANLFIKARDRQKYGMVKEELIVTRRGEALLNTFSKNKILRDLISDFALKISFFNSKDLDANMHLALYLLLGLFAFVFIAFIIMLICFFPLWYFALLYSLILSAAIFFFILVLSSYMNARLLKELPEALRILSSRYSGINNISKAIALSMGDFEKGIQKDMLRIYDALCLNDMEKIKETFSLIEKKHSNMHMSLLLELIWNAHYSGGEGEVKEEFDQMSEHLLEDIENKKDLSQAVLSYSVMYFIFAFALPIVRIFNNKILGKDALSYYSSRSSLLFSLLYYGLLVSLALISVFLERM